MSPDLIRRSLLSGLVALPLLAQAQGDTAPSPRPSEHAPADLESRTWAVNVGARSHAWEFDRRRANAPILMVSMEHQPFRHLSIFGGTHFGPDIHIVGAQVGSRLFFGETFHEGVFVSAQASYTLFTVDDDTFGRRSSVGGLVGYSHPLNTRWHLSLGVGVQSTQTRTTTYPPRPLLCPFGMCGPTSAPRTERWEGEEPLVQLGTTFQF
ncbi:DUF3575 domain-containing protein [Myxococcus sp. K38C18041901]|uniref:DUF3575 domain-containing protein n=1 Tax=Myxococcus guangdongensis TaxID=2906760 RepID=UPI0020A826DC|nr:DUF3575 domain-containing protein [Myxococcus guangdongensis]MCP3063299.1 DUF3575 domain-containing protein [Myxococcus guangdongensis]